MAETYRRWRLPELWEMVAADDTADAHLHLATLRRQQTALEVQRDRLRTLRDQLAEAWPPEKSDAAMAFIQRVNDMIVAMSLTANGAADVRTNLSLIVDAIQQTRTELAPLVDQYPHATNLPDPRVGQHTRKSLDDRARRVLMAADAAVVEPAAALNVSLPIYQRISLQAETPASPVTTNGSSSGGSSAGGFSRSAVGGFAPPRFSPPEFTAGLTQDEEVLLTGGPVDDVGRGPTSSFSGAADATRPTGGTLFGPGRVLGADRLSVPGPLNAPGPSGGAQPRGVIGGAAGGAPAGRRAPGTTGVHGAAARSAVASALPSGRRGSGGSVQDESWAVPEGVAPVIEPPAVRPHDPGPGVLGIDR